MSVPVSLSTLSLKFLCPANIKAYPRIDCKHTDTLKMLPATLMQTWHYCAQFLLSQWMLVILSNIKFNISLYVDSYAHIVIS